MAIVPIPPTFAAGDIVTPEKLNAYRDALNFALNPPRCTVQRNLTNQVMNNNDYVAFDSVTKNEDNMVNLGTDATRIYINTAGQYSIDIQWIYTDSASGSYRTFCVVDNGGNNRIRWNQRAVGATDFASAASGTYYFNAGDTIRIRLERDGTAITLKTGGTEYAFQCSVRYLGS